MHTFLFVPAGGKNVRVDLAHVLYFEAKTNWTKIKLTDKSTIISNVHLKRFQEMLPSPLFCRVHRAYIVSLNKITSFDRSYIYFPSERIPCGKTYRSKLHNSVTIIGSETKKAKKSTRQKAAVIAAKCLKAGIYTECKG